MKAVATRAPRARVLAAGDALAIVLFAVVGLANHREGITAAGLARNTLPILSAWFALAPLTDAYRRPGLRTMLATWAIAVPVGVALRAVILRRDADESQVVFALITMAVTLAFLLGWRLAARLVTRRA